MIRRSTFALQLLASCCLGIAAAHSAFAQEGADSLVSKDRIELNLRGAEVILDAAQEKAREMNVPVNIAIVDDGGHLIAFARMDGARPASGYTAQTKAQAAATFRRATGPIARPGEEPNVLLNLSLQNAAAANGGRFTSLFGGVPVVVEEQVIGAVGVGGGTGEQDAEIARAGIAALLTELGEKPDKTP